jgi:hypothetical protein
MAEDWGNTGQEGDFVAEEEDNPPSPCTANHDPEEILFTFFNRK